MAALIYSFASLRQSSARWHDERAPISRIHPSIHPSSIPVIVDRLGRGSFYNGTTRLSADCPTSDVTGRARMMPSVADCGTVRPGVVVRMTLALADGESEKEGNFRPPRELNVIVVCLNYSGESFGDQCPVARSLLARSTYRVSVEKLYINRHDRVTLMMRCVYELDRRPAPPTALIASSQLHAPATRRDRSSLTESVSAERVSRLDYCNALV